MKEYKKGIKSTAGVLLNHCLISEEELKELKQQLAEKDKEIKKHIDALEYLENNIPNQRQAIRKQVCDEIRKKFDKLCEVQDNLDYICTYGFDEILDQIEKGE